jgi:hypothetical protein
MWFILLGWEDNDHTFEWAYVLASLIRLEPEFRNESRHYNNAFMANQR